MLCVVTEETDRVIAERRVATLRDVASALANTQTEQRSCKGLNQQLNRNKKDLPFTLTYLFDDRSRARLATTSGVSGEHSLALAELEQGIDVHGWRTSFHSSGFPIDRGSGEHESWLSSQRRLNRPVKQATCCAHQATGSG
jgi:hypothetical protein